MEVKLSPEQMELIRTVRGVLSRSPAVPGPVVPSGEDPAAFDLLQDHGLLDLITAGASLVEVVLVVEEAAAHAPGAPVGQRALVAARLLGESIKGRVALTPTLTGGLTRGGAQAECVLAMDGDGVVMATADAVRSEPVLTRWGYPVTRVSVQSGSRLRGVCAGDMRRLWQIAIAAEAGGLMEAATLLAVNHVKDRRQFGRPIGAYQSIQHRLARAWMLSQGAKWLARQAAWHDSDYLASTAACYAQDGMREVMSTTHQVSGAIGITDEYGLTRYTSKMAWLQTELGGASENARRAAATRWKETAAVPA